MNEKVKMVLDAIEKSVDKSLLEAVKKSSLDYETAIQKFNTKPLYVHKAINLTPDVKTNILWMAEAMTPEALTKYITQLNKGLESWARLTYGSNYYYSELGNAAQAKWKDLIQQLNTKLNYKSKKLSVVTNNKKVITFQNGNIYIDGKKVTKNSEYGYVHIEGRGKPAEMSRGAYYGPDTARNQLQGITYVHVFHSFQTKVINGKDWKTIDAEMQSTKGPISGETPGSTWKEIKEYLDLR